MRNELKKYYKKMKSNKKEKEKGINYLNNKIKREEKKNKNKTTSEISPPSNPDKITFLKNLAKDPYSMGTNNTFCSFKSINDNYFLIYSDINQSIISYNITNNQKINELKNSHDKDIINIRHYLDENNKRDLIISNDNNNIKLWNLNNFECLLFIKNVNKKDFLFSTCLLKDNNRIYIISSNYNFQKVDCSDPIKIFDLNGNKIKEINNSNDGVYLIDNYYDNKISKNYIFTGNDYYVQSYDYNENKKYHIYADLDKDLEKENHLNLIIDNKDSGEIKLIDASEAGIIRIWNFHSGLLIKKIHIEYNINSICFWNQNFLFIGCKDKIIRLIDINKEIIIKDFKGHNNKVISIKKAFHPKFGDCLMSKSLLLGPIKLWVIKISKKKKNK